MRRKHLKNWHFSFMLFFAISLLAGACRYPRESKKEDFSAYLFTYFVGNGPGQESIHYALSRDGFNYRALNNNQPIISSEKISTSGGVRDPHILRSPNGKTFFMVVTDLYVPEMGWSNTAMVMLKSTDLINWTSSVVNIPNAFPEKFGEVNRVWAPQTIYDPEKDKYMLYWSMRFENDPDIIYYAYANEDFTGLETEPGQLLFSPDGSATIDGDIIYKDGKYHFFFKNEGPAKGIFKAESDKLTEGYVVLDKEIDQTKDAVEGSGIFKLTGTDIYILMYDVYTRGRYQFTESTDLTNFSVIDNSISMNFHPRHGTVIPITANEAAALVEKWGPLDKSVFLSFNSSMVKSNNVDINDKEQTIYIPVKQGTDLSSFDPGFKLLPGYSISPSGLNNFMQGPVEYTVKINEEKSKTYKVSASVDNGK